MLLGFVSNVIERSRVRGCNALAYHTQTRSRYVRIVMDRNDRRFVSLRIVVKAQIFAAATDDVPTVVKPTGVDGIRWRQTGRSSWPVASDAVHTPRRHDYERPIERICTV